MNMKKLVSILVVASLVLGFSIILLPKTTFSLVLQAPDEVWVDDNYDDSTPGWNVDHFDTIQGGIDAVEPGGTVHVAEGTYTEQLTIDKSITLMAGSSPVLDFSGFTGSTKHIVDAQGAHDEVAGIYVNASDVTIDGFHFIGIPYNTSNPMGELDTVIRAYTTADNLTVQNCVFDPPTGSAGRVAITVKWADNLRFLNNEINDYIYGVNLVDAGDSIDNALVQGNTFTQTQYMTATIGGTTYDICEGVQLWLGDNLQVIDNTFTGPGTTGTGNTATGMIVAVLDFNNYFEPGGTKTIRVENNTIENYYDGVDTCSNGIIEGNTISNNAIGVYVEDVPGIAPTINYNNIEGNFQYGVINDHTAVTLDAENNWWGDESGPYHPTTNPSATGNAVSNNVDYTPWLVPFIQVEKIDDPDPVMQGMNLTYTVNWAVSTNWGSWDGTTLIETTVGVPSGLDFGSLELIDTLPDEVNFISCTGGGSETGGVVTWDLGPLTPGSSGTVSVVCEVKPDTPDGTITNEVELKLDTLSVTDEEDTTVSSTCCGGAVIHDARTGAYASIATSTGEPIWRITIPSKGYDTGWRPFSSFYTYNNNIYAGYFGPNYYLKVFYSPTRYYITFIDQTQNLTIVFSG